MNKVVYRSDKITYDKGFVYTASLEPVYYELALYSARTLKDFFPDANITLYTHEDWVDDRVKNIFSEVRTGVQHFKRARLLCNKNNPYTYAVAIDCDSIICHKDVAYIFDCLKSYDIIFGVNHLHTVSNPKLSFIDKNCDFYPTLHGSLSLFKKSNLIQDFLQSWYDEYVINVSSDWRYKWAYDIWKKFDMFALWTIQNNLENRFNRFEDLKIGNFPNRWNTTIFDTKKKMGGRPVIQQYPTTILNNNTDFAKEINKKLKKYPKNKKTEDLLKFS